jgi:hypothetical protein
LPLEAALAAGQSNADPLAVEPRHHHRLESDTMTDRCPSRANSKRSLVRRLDQKRTVDGIVAELDGLF